MNNFVKIALGVVLVGLVGCGSSSPSAPASTDGGTEITTASWHTPVVVAEKAYSPDLTLDNKGFAHICYSHGNVIDDISSLQLRYITNKSGTWVSEIVDPVIGNGWYCSIQRDREGNLHISYFNAHPRNDLRYATNASGKWVTQTIDEAGKVGMLTSLAIDSKNKIHISYMTEAGTLKYATNNTDDEKWITTTLDEKLGFDWAQSETSIGVDSKGRVHIAYYDRTKGDLKYAHNEAGEWKKEIIDSEGSVGSFASLRINSDDHVYVSYYDMTKGQLKYAKNTLGKWEMKSISREGGNIGSYSSLAFNKKGTVEMSSYDSRAKDLLYMSEPRDSEQDVGKETSLETYSGKVQEIHIVYYDTTNHRVKYVEYSE